MNETSPIKVRTVLTDVNQGRRLLSHMWAHFKEDRCFDEAASLSYTSLLSLVPLLAVVFGIASAFPVFEQWSGELKQFVYANMVPDAGTQFQDTIEQFLGSVSKLTLTGTFFLIITALLLMMRIEKSLNLIWRVPKPRSLVNKITVYWAVLTLGPLALGAATALSAQPLLDWVGGNTVDIGIMRSVGTFALTWTAFALMFLLVPNCKVPFTFATLGALLSTILFTLAKTGFVAFISRANYSVIYGALASVPIFLLWLYIVWAVILLGASLAASLTTFTDRSSDWDWPKAWEFLLVYRVLGHFYEAQGEGRSLTLAELLALEPGVSSSRLQTILRSLMHENLLVQDSDEAWVLKQDLSRYTLRDLYLAGDYHLPMGKDVPVPSDGQHDMAFIQSLSGPLLDMEQTLATLYGGTAR